MKTHLCSFYLMRLPVRDDVVRDEDIDHCLFICPKYNNKRLAR